MYMKVFLVIIMTSQEMTQKVHRPGPSLISMQHVLVSVKEQKNVGYPHGYDGSVVMVGSRHNEMRIQLKKNVSVKMQLDAVVNL